MRVCHWHCASAYWTVACIFRPNESFRENRPITDSLQQVTQYAYDNLYRRTSTTDAPSGVTSFAYDAVGNMLSLTDPVSNTTSWVYDARNRVVEETNQLSFTRYFVYDAVGNLTRRTDRNGRVIEYTYDNLYRQTQENWLDEYESTVRTLDFSFDAAGQLVEAAEPAAAYSYAHDNLGRIVSIGQTYAGLSVPLQFTQQFDAVGNRSTRTRIATDGYVTEHASFFSAVLESRLA